MQMKHCERSSQVQFLLKFSDIVYVWATIFCTLGIVASLWLHCREKRRKVLQNRSMVPPTQHIGQLNKAIK